MMHVKHEQMSGHIIVTLWSQMKNENMIWFYLYKIKIGLQVSVQSYGIRESLLSPTES